VITFFQVETFFGNARDIEWAICGHQLYLLQVNITLK